MKSVRGPDPLPLGTGPMLPEVAPRRPYDFSEKRACSGENCYRSTRKVGVVAVSVNLVRCASLPRGRPEVASLHVSFRELH